MKDIERVLIFSTVWPEPSSSAAGVRQMHWVNFFLRQGAKVTLSAPAKVKGEQDWGALQLPSGVEVQPLPLNQSSVKEVLAALNPDCVMFDRFILEEQFGHFVYETCPRALVVLETQDLHLVRRAREGLKENYLSLEKMEKDFYHTDTALRETASLLRVDYSFLVSSFEEKLLTDEFKIGKEKVKWVPFFFEEPFVQSSWEKSWSDRSDFSWVGNFRHAPNVDGLRWFRNEIWPVIRKALPSAQLKIYGAYPSEEVSAWNKAGTGIQIKGSVKTLDEVFAKARVNLAPLRFGAGVKGKVLDGFRYGVPCVTTKIGAEGLLPLENTTFPGKVVNDPVTFAQACIDLYQDQEKWNQARVLAQKMMSEFYSEVRADETLVALFKKLFADKKTHVLPDWNSKILRHELFNSHKYFSKWIEVKEAQRSKNSIL